MSHSNLVALVVTRGDAVLLGRHAAGPHAGAWGVASFDSALARRPQRTAARLAEHTMMGIGGGKSELEDKCKSIGRTALGLQVYTLETENDSLPSQIRGVTAFLNSCFPRDALGAATIPAGLAPWTDVKWWSPSDAKPSLDPVARDAVAHVAARASLNKVSE